MRTSLFNKLTGVLYAVLIILLSALFFTNDFGLVDLRKTSVVIGVGIDVEGDDLKLTAQLALPQPAENGEKTEFSSVTGKGKTVACAFNEVNAKTGFYPRLVFCKIIILGESCFTEDVNALLNYFFGNEHTGLAIKVAACKGGAGDLLSMQLPYGDSTTDFIDRLLSDEAEKSGNVSAIDLNDFGQDYFSKSSANYMPFIENKQEEDSSQGGQQGQEGGSGGSSQGGQQGQEGGSGGSSQGGQQGESKPPEFICEKTAVFSKGYFKGLLDKDKAFALNILKNDISHTYTECGSEKQRSVLGLRNCKGSTELLIESGAPVLKLSFSARAKLLDDANDSEDKPKTNNKTPQEALDKGKKALTEQITALFEYARENDCDVLGVKDLLYKKHYKYYETFKDVIYDKLTLVCDVELKSSG